jgi:broad specificity phosphatase PhoE
MTILYAIRHCDYENPKGIIPGNLPGVHLNDVGRRQAERLANYFSNAKLSAIYSSPLERSLETAEVIAKKFNLKVIIERDLTELRNNLDGTSFSHPDLVRAGGNAHRDPRNSGETMAEMVARMQAVVYKILEKHHENAGFVSHGDPIEGLRAVLENRKLMPEIFDKNDDYIAWGDVYRLDFEGRNFVKAERLYIQEDKIVDDTPKK